MNTLSKWFGLPLRDFSAAMEVCLIEGKPRYLFVILFSSVVSWWVYVPLHELLHALGCFVAGGKVHRLEISGIYGASLLRRVFPFVSAGSEYAGRLTGFDTGGSDFTFFMTDCLPYVLTIFFGVPLLKSIPSLRSHPFFKSICLGLAAPFAYAPFMSIFGDYYEMGSLFISRLAASGAPSVNPDRWRSDDIFRLVDRLSASHGVSHTLDGTVVISSLLLGGILVFATYWAGALWTMALPIRNKQGAGGIHSSPRRPR
jgi:hypothetical protein